MTVRTWLPWLGALLTGLFAFAWLSVLFGFLSVTAALSLSPMEHLGTVAWRVTSLGLVAAVGLSIALAVWARSRLAAVSVGVALCWVIALLVLLLFGPAPFVYTIH